MVWLTTIELENKLRQWVKVCGIRRMHLPVDAIAQLESRRRPNRVVGAGAGQLRLCRFATANQYAK